MVLTKKGSLGTRSELLITNTSMAESGSFFCSAENKAGKSMAIYTLQVELYRSDTLVMEMIAVAVCLITILLLLMVIVNCDGSQWSQFSIFFSPSMARREDLWSRVRLLDTRKMAKRLF